MPLKLLGNSVHNKSRSKAIVYDFVEKRCNGLATASDKVDQLLAHVRWFSPGTPASSTTKTCRHDIAEILLKVGLDTLLVNSIYYKQQ